MVWGIAQGAITKIGWVTKIRGWEVSLLGAARLGFGLLGWLELAKEGCNDSASASSWETGLGRGG